MRSEKNSTVLGGEKREIESRVGKNYGTWGGKERERRVGDEQLARRYLPVRACVAQHGIT
jgi:hypothetical protein